jgi:glucan-binding YG repeat protein
MSTGVDGFKPVNATTKFTTTTPAFYVTGDINNAPDDTVISAVWYYLDTDSDYMIDQSQYQVEGTNNSFYFSLSIPDNGWPVGTYRVDLYIDDAVDQSIFFTVE